MHPPVIEFVQSAIDKHGPFGRVVEFGSLDINGSVRDLFGDAMYLGIDVQDGPGVDLIEDAAHWDGRGEWDCVVSTEVLEHAPTAKDICRSAFRALRPGGVFVVTAASTNRGPHSAIDEQPIRAWEFYRNVTEQDLKDWTGPFTDREIEYHWRGDIYGWFRKWKTFAVIPVVKNEDGGPLLDQLPPEIDTMVIPNKGELNLSAKWNRGLEWAAEHGEQEWNVAILNDDLLLGHQCLQRLALALRAKDHHGAAYPGAGLVDPGKFGYLTNTDFASQTMSGFCFMVKGEDGIRFDERFRWWYGDADFERQLRALGRVPVAVGAAQVIHLHPTESSRRPDLLAVAKEDEKQFAAKWNLDPESLFLAQNPGWG